MLKLSDEKYLTIKALVTMILVVLMTFKIIKQRKEINEWANIVKKMKNVTKKSCCLEGVGYFMIVESKKGKGVVKTDLVKCE